jgi:hypothetical protein
MKCIFEHQSKLLNLPDMKLKLILILAASSFVMASCLKSKGIIGLQDDNGSIVTEISDVNVDGSEKLTVLNANPPTESVDVITLKYYAPRANKPPGGVIHVKLVVAPASGYTMLPPGGYSLNLDQDIPSSGELVVPITINKSSLDLSQSYGMTVKIAQVSAGVISELAKQIVLTFQVKNQYDGKYNITWTNYHPTNNPGYTGSTSTIEMHTSGGNSVKMYWPLYSAYCAPAILNGGLAYFGAQEPNFTVNANNTVTVQNSYNGAVTFYTMATGFNSRYDPATKTFYVKWGYSYATPGVFDPGCREWTQTFNYTGPR